MARLLRIAFPGAIYHVMVRGNERRLIFRDNADRQRFLERLGQSQELYSVRLYLACLMPNHLHLLMETPRANLSSFMARLMTAYTVYYNLRHHRVGHLTQGRYKAQIVEGNEYLLKLSRYIHLNPVSGRRWVDVSVEDRRKELRAYRWSTYRSYAGLERDWGFIDYGPLRTLVENELGADYAAYVETGLASDDQEFAKLYRQAQLSMGSESFSGRVTEAHAEAVRSVGRPEDAALRRTAAWRSVEETMKVVAAVLGVSEANLKERRRGSLARTAAAWALVKHGGLTQRAAAAALGMNTGGAVSHQLKKWESIARQDPRWQEVITMLADRLEPIKY